MEDGSRTRERAKPGGSHAKGRRKAPPDDAAQGTALEEPRPVDPLTPTIFHEPWWLEAATGGRYEEVVVKRDGRVVGRFPYLRRKQYGLWTCVEPELTHFLGPAVDEGVGSPVSRTIRRHQITRELIEQLPPASYFQQPLHRGIPDALPFEQNGFVILTTFTYEIAPAPEATIWKNLRDKTRNVIRRAQEQTELVELEPDTFLALYESNLQSRGWFENYMYKSNASRVLEAALSRGRGRLLGARDASGTVVAATFNVWDDAVSYYMLTTRTPNSHNGVVSRLVWEAIRDGASQGRIFDFEGVGTKGSVLFYSGFGGEVRPRFTASRVAPLFRLTRATASRPRELLRKLRLPGR